VTKTSTLTVIGTVGVVVLIYWIRHSKQTKSISKSIGVYLGAFAFLPGLNFLRLALTGQPLFFMYPPSGLLGNTFWDYFSFRFTLLIREPLGGMWERYFLEYLFSTALFSEYRQYMNPNVLFLAQIIAALGMVILIGWLALIFVKYPWRNKNVGYLAFPIYMVFLLASHVYFRWNFPSPWNQHFRYILPAILVFGLMFGICYDQIENKRVKTWMNIVIVLFMIGVSAYYSVITYGG